MSKTEDQSLRDLVKKLGGLRKPDFGKLLYPPLPIPDPHRIGNITEYNTAVDIEKYRLQMYKAQLDAGAKAMNPGPPQLTTMPAIVLGDFTQLRNEMLINGIWLSPLSAVDGEMEMSTRAHTRVQLTSNGRLRSLDHPAMFATATGRSDMIGCFHEDGPGGTCVLRCPMAEFAISIGAAYSLHLDIGFK